jgi:NADPH oxidase
MHKVVAWVVLLAGIMHTLAHLVNYGCVDMDGIGKVLIMTMMHRLSPDVTWEFYGPWAWTTGVGLFICMMFMYGAVPENVKTYQFEIFWYSHHFFIAFFILLFPHGRGGINRGVLPWIPGPVRHASHWRKRTT